MDSEEKSASERMPHLIRINSIVLKIIQKRYAWESFFSSVGRELRFGRVGKCRGIKVGQEYPSKKRVFWCDVADEGRVTAGISALK